MKKTLVVLSMLMVVVFVSAFAYAGAPVPTTQPLKVSVEDREAWFKERLEWKRAQIAEALKEGLITKEEAKTWNDHFASMEKFHKENGFMPSCSGVCNFNNGSGNRNGFGRGMARGNKWKS